MPKIDFSYTSNGASFMEKSSPYGMVKGAAFVHPDDLDIANQWDGARICEFRCNKEIAKLHRNKMRERYLGAKNLYEHILQQYETIKLTGEEELMINAMNLQVKGAHKEYLKTKNKYDNMSQKEYMFCDKVVKARRDFREKMKKQQESKETNPA